MPSAISNTKQRQPLDRGYPNEVHVELDGLMRTDCYLGFYLQNFFQAAYQIADIWFRDPTQFLADTRNGSAAHKEYFDEVTREASNYLAAEDAKISADMKKSLHRCLETLKKHFTYKGHSINDLQWYAHNVDGLEARVKEHPKKGSKHNTPKPAAHPYPRHSSLHGMHG